MAKKLHLHIADPCHEDWETMTPQEKGRFCDSCQKQVVDFSMMSDREIAQFFKRPSTGSVCGRFMADQLNRDIQPERKRLPWIKYFFQFALPAFLLGREANAQQTPKKQETSCTSQHIVLGGIGESFLQTEFTIVVKETGSGKGIPYATVRIMGIKQKGVADKHGKAVMPVDAYSGKQQVEISCVGYKTKKMQVSFSSQPQMKMEVELEVEPIVMEEIVVVGEMTTAQKSGQPIPHELIGYVTGLVGYTPPAQKHPLLTTIRPLTIPGMQTDTMTFNPPVNFIQLNIPGVTIVDKPVNSQETAVKVAPPVLTTAPLLYPNPVKAGQPITIELNAVSAETLMLKLTATDGKTLIIRQQPISKGNNRFTINTDPAWTAGIYFLVFSNEKGILLKTEELLIQ